MTAGGEAKTLMDISNIFADCEFHARSEYPDTRNLAFDQYNYSSHHIRFQFPRKQACKSCFKNFQN